MLGLLAALCTVAEPVTTGSVLVPDLRGKPAEGHAATRVWVTVGEAREPVAGPLDGAFAPGTPLTVPAGVVFVEIGTERVEANRVRVQVEAGKVSVVPVGLVAIAVEPAAAQAPDACAPWTGAFELALQPLQGAAGPVVTRVVTEGPTGLALVPAGYYRIAWNGGGIEVAVRPWTRYHVETGRVGPLAQPDVHVAEGEGAVARTRLCERRTTRLLARPWVATYMEPSTEPPFRQRVWAPVAVTADERKGGPFEALKRPKVRGELSPEAAAATPLWEAP